MLNPGSPVGGRIAVTSLSGSVLLHNSFFKIALLDDMFVSDCSVGEKAERSVLQNWSLALKLMV